MSARFTQLLPWILKWEGDVFTDDPADRGGATRYGVTQERYTQYRKDAGLPVRSVRDIDRSEVEAIYRRYYWDAIGGDSLPVPLDLALFNVAVNSGPARAKRWNAELNREGQTPLSLARAICDRYEAFYHAIVANDATQAKWLRGWLNRLNDCRHEIEETAETEDITWSLLLGTKPLGPAWANPGDGGRAYFPARRLLEAILGHAQVNAHLGVQGEQLLWKGRAIPVRETEREPGVLWTSVRDVAIWLGLDVLVDGKERTITLSRPTGAAKAVQ